MEVFNLLKQACLIKPFVKLSELPMGEHVVSEVSLVQTRFGPTLKAELDDKLVYLPKRFSKDMTEEKVARLNTLQIILVHSGVDPDRHNL